MTDLCWKVDTNWLDLVNKDELVWLMVSIEGMDDTVQKEIRRLDTIWSFLLNLRSVVAHLTFTDQG